MRTPLRNTALALACLLLLSACASAPAADGSRSNPSLLTRAELEASGAANLYDAVNILRPRWLTGRAPSVSPAGQAARVVVFQGSTQIGDVEALRQYGTGYPAALRWMDGIEATTSLPGLSQVVAGAIVIEVMATGR
jgi:hypothetical protein